jgi:hypothetical protein
MLFLISLEKVATKVVYSGIRDYHRMILVRSEPVFVNLLRSSGIDSQPGGPVRQPYLSYRPAIYLGWRNRFLVSLNVYKYGLWQRDSSDYESMRPKARLEGWPNTAARLAG